MTLARADIKVGHVLDELAKLPEASVHCAITSPPYWGLRDYKLEPQVWGGDDACDHEWSEPQRLVMSGGEGKETFKDGCGGGIGGRRWESSSGSRCYCGAWRGSLGLEPTIELFLDHLVSVFEAVRRVLRDDGQLWINLGDCYSSQPRAAYGDQADNSVVENDRAWMKPTQPGLKPLDQCCIPERFKLRMIEAGWYCRSTVIWAKGLSFCPEYSGSVMPESINGTRWERCRVKVSHRDLKGDPRMAGARTDGYNMALNDARLHPERLSQFADCPGCSKCEPNGGYVLRRGSWRPTSAFEYVYQFTKTSSYYSDSEAAREEAVRAGEIPGGNHPNGIGDPHSNRGGECGLGPVPSGRNLRSVWAINPQPYPEAHFATFPEKLVEPMIRVSTSEKGVCPECGAPWARVVDTKRWPRGDTIGDRGGNDHGQGGRAFENSESTTLGWRSTCGHDHEPIPATILDCFAGSGTSLLVARKLGRHSIGIELNPEYADLARKRLAEYAPLFSC